MPSSIETVAGRGGLPLLTRSWPNVGALHRDTPEAGGAPSTAGPGAVAPDTAAPGVARPRAGVLIVPGLGEHSGRYERTGSIMAAAGLTVRSFDLPGFGGSGGRRAFVTRMDVWLDDVADRLAALRSELDAEDAAAGASAGHRPVVLLGHSLGGLVVLSYAVSDRPQPDLLIASAPWLADYQPAWRLAIARILGRVLPTVSVANGFDGGLLSRDPAVGADYLSDPLNYHRTTLGLGRQAILAQAYVLEHLDRIRVPMLVTHGSADPLVPPASSEILAMLPNVERRLYPDLRHETLNEPEGPQVAADMVAWIDRRIGAGPG